MVTIRRKYLNNFHGQSTASTGWFNLDHEWSKRIFSTLEPDFYKKFENNIEGLDIEAYTNFVVPLDNSKLYLSMRNDSVTANKNKNSE